MLRRPNRAGFAFWRHWVIDLPQDAQLLAAVPVPQAELVLMRSHAPGGKVRDIRKHALTHGQQLMHQPCDDTRPMQRSCC